MTKILWANTTLPLVASGIEFATYTNTTNGTERYTAYARKEVIVAAGAIRVRLFFLLLWKHVFNPLDRSRHRLSCSSPASAMPTFSAP